ncbi:hypothetical protein CPC08DRAFT_704394 [Agrocybe pediades]|nr:hypothetical protein CPC08DRAFT_704394 [Agrocybe pediades]
MNAEQQVQIPSRRSWTSFRPRSSNSSRPSSSSSTASRVAGSILMSPREDQAEAGPSQSPAVSDSVVAPKPVVPSGAGFPRSVTYDTPPVSRSTTPKRWSTRSLLTSSPKVTTQSLDNQGSQVTLNALERTASHQPQSSSKSPEGKHAGSFGKSFSSMMGGLSNLSLSRTSTRESTQEDKDRGRSMLKLKRIKSASQAPADDHERSRSASRTRSQSPFTFRRFRSRDVSPTPEPVRMSQSDVESDTASSVAPRSTAYTDDDSGDENFTTDAETDDASSSDEEDIFDPETERNTERNALIPPAPSDAAGVLAQEIEDPDPVGEGVNIVVAPEPYFPSSLNSLGSTTRGKRNPRRRKSVKTHEPLPFVTSRPIFQRDRCTITLTQGDPVGKLGTRRKRRYVIASDLSEESRYAVEWGIGTVLRDGDEMIVVTVVENEAKVDPEIPSAAVRATKLRSQQERQGLAYILVRQVTGLLQRTKLNVVISCQAWHAKNSRHMLLDIVDHVEPTMLIVGSRGLGQLNGILLGSTSHYLIQKCSVPVMVARRRLKRPPKKSAHLSTQRAHISLAEAGIDRVAAKVDQDVQIMRDEIQKDDHRRDGGPGSRDKGAFDGVPEEADQVEEGEDEDEADNEDEPIGVKVAG